MVAQPLAGLSPQVRPVALLHGLCIVAAGERSGHVQLQPASCIAAHRHKDTHHKITLPGLDICHVSRKSG